MYLIDNVLSREDNKPINFSRQELDSISAATTDNGRRLLFLMCCIARIYETNALYLNSKSNIKLQELCKLARTKCRVCDQEYILRDLYQEKLVVATDRILCFEFPFFESSTEVKTELLVEPSEDMIEDFERWFDTNYCFCQSCGKKVKRINNRIKYCRDCSVKNNRENALSRKRHKVGSK